MSITPKLLNIIYMAYKFNGSEGAPIELKTAKEWAAK